MLLNLLEKIGISLQQLEAEGVVNNKQASPVTQPQSTDPTPVSPVASASEKHNV